jgi:hypothetical protein
VGGHSAPGAAPPAEPAAAAWWGRHVKGTARGIPRPRPRGARPSSPRALTPTAPPAGAHPVDGAW